MKNKFISFFSIFFLNFFLTITVCANEQFNFNVSEIEILDEGNKIIGSKRGTISSTDGIINAETFVYLKTENILNAKGNVVIEDKTNDYKFYSEEITYKKMMKLFLQMETLKVKFIQDMILIQMILFFVNEKVLKSANKTKIIDNKNQTFYELEKFSFDIDEEVLRGEKILVNLNYNLPQNDKLYFGNGIFDLKNKSFIAKDIEIKLKKIFLIT